MKDQFLEKIHQKINRKKNFNYGLTFVFSLCLMVIMTYSSMNHISDLKLEMDWQMLEQFEFAEDFFDWELNYEISDEEIYNYLIDEEGIYFIIEELVGEELEILINKINMES